MTTNSQLSTTEPKQQQEETKQATRTGIESQKWGSHGGLSVKGARGENGGKDLGIRSVIGRYKIDRGR